MKFFTYKTYPAVNLDKVESIHIESMSGSGVIFHFVNHEVRWGTKNATEAINVYNAIIDALSDKDHKHII